ncbi:uncharacterized protein LOC125557547 [Nematostella vectensis]|uniref:uncharacterized protein LOC125557547 n=1 Tax=Nematostella vectensis TaxID=45351 RepID=UPI0020778994|nr:uncharacterized protein LOC125557547 [Nematostella vectensis]
MPATGESEETPPPAATSFQPGYAFKPPEPVKLAKNGVESWKIWKQLWQHYCIVSNADSHSPQFKKSLLISTMGIEALQIYNGCDPVETDTAKDILTKLDAHILGETNETYERYKFNTRVQKPDESIDSYVASLKTLAETCNFCECLKTSLLRDRVVLGVKDDHTRKRLLQEGKLTLQKALDICHSYEKTSDQLKIISGKEEEVHRLNINKQKTKGASHGQRNKPVGNGKPGGTNPRQAAKCKFCGYSHTLKKEFYKAWGKRCNNCKAPTISRVAVQVWVARNKSILLVTDLTPIPLLKCGPLYAEMCLKDGRRVKFQVDCGATVNVINQKYVPQNTQLQESKNTLSMYNKTTLKPVGKCRIITINLITKKKYNVMFEVVKEDLTPLLSRKAAEQMKLITVNYDNFKQVHVVTDGFTELVTEYKAVFDDTAVGCFSGKVNLKVDGNAVPTQSPPRRVPISVKPALEKELHNLVKLGVLKPVTEPTQWCSQISIQKKKNDQLRICLDPRVLNEALQREIYPLPTIDDILPEFANAKLFSKFDLAHGYWHCELDEESSYMTTFITVNGRFRWCRLPFGLKVSSEIFQRKLMESLSGLRGVVCVADDILVYGHSEGDHDEKLRNLLDVCARNNIKLNHQKSVFKTTEVEFLGHGTTTTVTENNVYQHVAIRKDNCQQNSFFTAQQLDVVGFSNFSGRLVQSNANLAVVAPLNNISRKVMLSRYDVDGLPTFLVVDFMRKTFPVTLETIVVPYYPVTDDMVLVRGDQADTIWGARVLTFNLERKSFNGRFFKERDDGLWITEGTRDQVIHFISVLGLSICQLCKIPKPVGDCHSPSICISGKSIRHLPFSIPYAC